MENLLNITFIIGAIFAVLGSFLPWKQEGDFLSFWTYGIQINPNIKDNGGLVIVMLIVVLVALNFRSPNIITRPINWCIPISFIIFAISIYHLINLYISRRIIGNIIGAPVIQIGLIMVLIGSTLIIISTFYKYIVLNR
jgi:hypothetical protein